MGEDERLRGERVAVENYEFPESVIRLRSETISLAFPCCELLFASLLSSNNQFGSLQLRHANYTVARGLSLASPLSRRDRQQELSL